MWIWGMLAQHLIGTWASCPHITRGLGRKRRCGSSVYLPSWVLWWATPETNRSADFPVGPWSSGIQGSPGVLSRGALFRRNFLADVWLLMKPGLVINLWYFSEDVKLEKACSPWLGEKIWIWSSKLVSGQVTASRWPALCFVCFVNSQSSSLP